MFEDTSKVYLNYGFIREIMDKIGLTYDSISACWDNERNNISQKEGCSHLSNETLTDVYLKQHIRHDFFRVRAEALYHVLMHEITSHNSKQGVNKLFSGWGFDSLIKKEDGSDFLLFEFKLGQPRPLAVLFIEKQQTEKNMKYVLSGCSYTADGEKGFAFSGDALSYNSQTGEFSTNYHAEEVNKPDKPIRGNTHFYIPSHLCPVTRGYYFDGKGAVVNFLLVDSKSTLLPQYVKELIEERGTRAAPKKEGTHNYISYDNLTPDIVSALLEEDFINQVKEQSELCPEL